MRQKEREDGLSFLLPSCPAVLPAVATALPDFSLHWTEGMDSVTPLVPLGQGQ